MVASHNACLWRDSTKTGKNYKAGRNDSYPKEARKSYLKRWPSHFLHTLGAILNCIRSFVQNWRVSWLVFGGINDERKEKILAKLAKIMQTEVLRRPKF